MPRRKKGCSDGRGKSGSGLSINRGGKPQQRNAANARERARMRVLSRAFCRLKTTLPWVPADTKLSKLDTLRLAASYIAHLKGILSDDPYSSSDEPTTHPSMSLTWPFGFNRPTLLLEGNGSSVGGGSEAEESIGGSSGCWDPESPTKDCVHLDISGQPDLLVNRHINMELEQGLKHEDPNNAPNPDICNNNNNNNNIINTNIIPYNYHPNHPNHSSSPYGFPNDIIMSMS